ncbi:MAG: acyltransferase family protein [Olegusella sp.]|nr:acyltransferase family protein [Olegusella sp.]
MDTVSQPAKKYYRWIDIAKGIAMVSVIASHTVIPGGRLHHFFYLYEIPLFFFLSGITFIPKPWRDLLSGSIRRLLLPYLLLCTVLLVPNILYDPSPSNVMTQILVALFGGGWTVLPFGFPGIGTAWFLLALFSARILANALFSWFENKGIPPFAQYAFVLIIAIAGRWIPVHLCWLPLDIDVAFVAVWFMFIGWRCKHYGMEPDLPDFKMPRAKKSRRLATAVITVLLLCLGTCCSRLIVFSPGARGYGSTWIFLTCLLCSTGMSAALCVTADIIGSRMNALVASVCQHLSFMGRYSMLAFILLCIDGHFVQWQNVGLYSMPYGHVVLSAVRVAYISVFMLLFLFTAPIANKRE